MDQPASARQPLIYNRNLATFGKNPFFRTEFEPSQSYQSRLSDVPQSVVPVVKATAFQNPHVSYEIARLSLDSQDIDNIPVVANPASLLPGTRYTPFTLQNKRSPQQDAILLQQQTLLGDTFASSGDSYQKTSDSNIPIKVNPASIPIRANSDSNSNSQSISELVSPISEDIASVSQGVSTADGPIAEDAAVVSPSVSGKIQDKPTASVISQEAAEAAIPLSELLGTISSSVSQGVQDTIISVSQSQQSLGYQKIPEAEIDAAVDHVLRKAEIANENAATEGLKTSSGAEISNANVLPIVGGNELALVDDIQSSTPPTTISQAAVSGQSSSGTAPLVQEPLPAAIDPNFKGNSQSIAISPVQSESVPADMNPNYPGDQPATVPSSSSPQEPLPAAIDPNYIGNSQSIAISPVQSQSVPADMNQNYPGDQPATIPSSSSSSKISNNPASFYPVIPASQVKSESQVPEDQSQASKDQSQASENESPVSVIFEPSIIPSPVGNVQQQPSSTVDTGSAESQSQNSNEVSTGAQEKNSIEIDDSSVGNLSPTKYDGTDAIDDDDEEEKLIEQEHDLFSLGRRRRPISFDEPAFEVESRHSNAENPTDSDTVSFVFSKRDVVDVRSETENQEPPAEIETVISEDAVTTETPDLIQTTEVVQEEPQSEVTQPETAEVIQGPAESEVTQPQTVDAMQQVSQSELTQPESVEPIQGESYPEPEASTTVAPDSAVSPGVTEESILASVISETDEQVLNALENDPNVQRAKYNFVASWNNEVLRRGLYFLRIADVYPNTGYVYMPDIEAYTKFIQSTPMVQYYTNEMLDAWTKAKDQLLSEDQIAPTEATDIITEVDDQETTLSVQDPIAEIAELNPFVPQQPLNYQDYLNYLTSQPPAFYPQIGVGVQNPFRGALATSPQQQGFVMQQEYVPGISNSFIVQRQNPVPGGVSSNLVNTGFHGIPGKIHSPISSFPKSPSRPSVRPQSRPMRPRFSTSHSSTTV